LGGHAPKSFAEAARPPNSAQLGSYFNDRAQHGSSTWM
jgi:hypothetical protein